MLPSTENVQIPEYQLYATVNHYSYITSGGHYTVSIKSEEIGAWVHCNDNTLECSTNTNIVTKDAYLLFYRKAVMTSSNVINLTYQSLK